MYKIIEIAQNANSEKTPIKDTFEKHITWEKETF